MAFHNQYPNRKDHRRPYRGSKRFDNTCRNHGSCGYCQGNRTNFDRRARARADEALRDFLHGND